MSWVTPICGTSRGAAVMPFIGTAEVVSWSSSLTLGKWMSALAGRPHSSSRLNLLGEDAGVMLDELGSHVTTKPPSTWANESRLIAASPPLVTNLNL